MFQLHARSNASKASSRDLSARDTFDALPRAIWKGRHFVNDDLISKKGSRGRIRDEGIFVREVIPPTGLGMLHLPL
ncbi:hypothetical protein F5Y12DRAFT_747181 [Xylaria sp. FL1777]|nr:hypothetical protein F5Y12DRAFT_747181 [Xylaria sp. FL1777]